MSLFISFEGGEGSGKSTQAEILRQRLQRLGVSVVWIREPGSTSLGDYLRAWLVREQREKITYHAEAFLFAAARAELVAKTIKPALRRPNTVVLADRYADSTTAYQGYGRRLPLKDVKVINRLATQEVMPSLTFVLDCPPEEGLNRVGSFHGIDELNAFEPPAAGRMDQEGTRRFELESLGFHRRVRAGYLRIAKNEPERVRLIDATQSVEDISGEIWSIVQDRLSQDVGVAQRKAGMNLPLWEGHDESASRPQAG